MQREQASELNAPPSGAVSWVGWSVKNPNRVGRATEKLWFNARDAIMRELGIIDISDIEVIQRDD